jgi:hypothetical protein
MALCTTDGQALQFKWSPLSTVYCEKCVNEHKRFLQRLNHQAYTLMSPNASDNNNGAVRGLIQHGKDRVVEIHRFASEHFELYGTHDEDRVHQLLAVADDIVREVTEAEARCAASPFHSRRDPASVARQIDVQDVVNSPHRLSAVAASPQRGSARPLGFLRDPSDATASPARSVSQHSASGQQRMPSWAAAAARQRSPLSLSRPSLSTATPTKEAVPEEAVGDSTPQETHATESPQPSREASPAATTTAAPADEVSPPAAQRAVPTVDRAAAAELAIHEMDARLRIVSQAHVAAFAIPARAIVARRQRGGGAPGKVVMAVAVLVAVVALAVGQHLYTLSVLY